MITVSIQSVRAALRGLRLLKPTKKSEDFQRCVHIRGIEGLVTFQITQGRESLRFEAQGVSDHPGELLVPYDQLVQATRRADPGSWIAFEPGPEPTITQVVADTTVKVPVEPLDTVEIPEERSVRGQGIELPVGSIQQALAVASTDPQREVLNGVHLEPDAVVATNGRQLYASRGLNLAVPDEGLLLPRSKVIGLLDPNKPADLFLCREASDSISHAKVYQGFWTWTSELSQLRFPNWKQVVPKPETHATRIEFSEGDVSRIAATVPRLPGADLENAPVWLFASESSVVVQSPSETPEVSVDCSSSRVTGPAVQVAFNRNFLLQALAHGFRILHLSDASSPVCMTRANAIHVWMPVRLPEPVGPAEAIPEPATANA